MFWGSLILKYSSIFLLLKSQQNKTMSVVSVCLNIRIHNQCSRALPSPKIFGILFSPTRTSAATYLAFVLCTSSNRKRRRACSLCPMFFQIRWQSVYVLGRFYSQNIRPQPHDVGHFFLSQNTRLYFSSNRTTAISCLALFSASPQNQQRSRPMSPVLGTSLK